MIAIALVAALAIAALAYLALRSQLATGPSLTGTTVVINATNDFTVRGILVAHHADRLVLRDAVVLHGSGEAPAGGLVHIPLGTVMVIQEIEPGSSA